MNPIPFAAKAFAFLWALVLTGHALAYDIGQPTRGAFDILPASGAAKSVGGFDPEVARAFQARRATGAAMDARGLLQTGLRPAYPDGLDCQQANSFFGQFTRGDGSFRSERFFQGRHGGMDIPAEGIEVIAVADGEVIEKREGDNIGGIGIILRHAPADTGLGVWTFTEYKHLKDFSTQPLNVRVRKGEVIGIAWNTGTVGGAAYGADGHYHLHLSAWYNATGEYSGTRFKLIPKDGYWADPLALMRGGPLRSNAAEKLPDDEKTVRFAYMTVGGRTLPEGAKIVWPFVCR